MGYCGNCGEKIEKGANFCGKCGAVVEKEQSEHVYDVIAPKNNSARVWKIIIPKETILSKSDIWTIQNDQTDTIFCKDKSNTYYFDIYLENGSVKSLSLHSADSYCGYNHTE